MKKIAIMRIILGAYYVITLQYIKQYNSYKLMAGLSVRYFLDIYITRKKMQEEGITNPSEEIKKFTNDFIEKLKNYPLDEEIILKNHLFFDSQGNIIIEFPG